MGSASVFGMKGLGGRVRRRGVFPGWTVTAIGGVLGGEGRERGRWSGGREGGEGGEAGCGGWRRRRGGFWLAGRALRGSLAGSR